MKCQKCDHTATFHVTELLNGEPVEYHLCEKHLPDLDSMPAEANPYRRLDSPGLMAALADRAAHDKLAAYMLPALCLALLDERPEVRIVAVYQIWQMGSAARSVVGALQNALKDPDERVRRTAEFALAAIQCWRPHEAGGAP